ncbi:type I toxin-antitoxin system Fst family toxin [Trichococcus flocculiformis]|uniref:type I toxin-antitoxin system Fst family toxin n=1 Tax=Trichococcus flocculiformis TaxID=82803 RepID=UPI003899F218
MLNYKLFCAIIMNGNLPRKGVLFVFDLISLVIAPLFVGLVLLLVEHWLDD